MTLAFERSILELMDDRGVVSKAEIAQRTHRTLSDIDRALKNLVRKGQVVKRSDGQLLYTRVEAV